MPGPESKARAVSQGTRVFCDAPTLRILTFHEAPPTEKGITMEEVRARAEAERREALEGQSETSRSCEPSNRVRAESGSGRFSTGGDGRSLRGASVAGVEDAQRNATQDEDLEAPEVDEHASSGPEGGNCDDEAEADPREQPDDASDVADDYLPDFDVDDTKEVEVVALADAVQPKEPEPPQVSVRDRLRSPVVQLVLLGAVGIVVCWVLFGSSGAQEVGTPAPVHSTFPTIEIKGAEPVTEEEIARKLREPAQAEVTDQAIAKELKAIAARTRKAAGVEAPPKPRRRLGGRGAVSDDSSDLLGSPALDGSTRETVQRRHVALAGFYAPGGTMKVEGAKEEEKQNRLALGVGEKLAAKLEVGISSGNNVPVLARLTKDIRSKGRTLAPKGSIVRGRFRADPLKIYVTFSELILPNGEKLEFEGYAVDGPVPGLVAVRREVEDDAGGAVLEETMGVAKDVALSVASGSIVGRVAQGVADGVIPETRTQAPSGVILEVAAGKRFQIVVTEGGR